MPKIVWISTPKYLYFSIVCLINIFLSMSLAALTTYVVNVANEFNVIIIRKHNDYNIEVLLRTLTPVSIFLSTIAIMFKDTLGFVKIYKFIHFLLSMTLALICIVFYFKYIDILTLVIFKLNGDVFSFYQINYLYYFSDKNKPELAHYVKLIGFACYFIMLMGVCFFKNAFRLLKDKDYIQRFNEDVLVEFEKRIAEDSI